ncbi:MAG: cysteine desulfurase family protein, partial [Candidatus Nanoarchaeia archaeon]|nr:cysteine desulfurase family protein [Candidatus Nanoarchaeia archaeon]
ATESDNLAILGVAEQLKDKGNHIITTKIEHKAILDPCKYLESKGYIISYLNVNKEGNINIEELKSLITQKTILISIMSANNEIGTINPLNEIGKIAKEHKILFHTDAAQAFGHIPLNINEMNIDLMSISGHKIYGPKGVGAIYVKEGVKLNPIMYGGGHERGLRSGTLNTPGIVGLGAASRIAKEELLQNSNRIKKLRDKLYELISSKIKVEINGTLKNRLPHNLSLYIEGIDAKALINEIKDYVACSTGSACTSNNIKPSYVILSLGYNANRANSTIRFGLGRFTTDEEIEQVAKILIKSVEKLKRL